MTMLPFRSGLSAGLPAAYLTGIGNVDAMKDQHGETYQYTRRSVRPAGLLAHPEIALKIYHLIRERTPLQENTVEDLERFLTAEIDAGHVDLKQRMGFVILGQGFVSINVWGKGNGLFAQAYSVEDSYSELTRQALERSAIACTWDSRILNFECRLWHYYLLTERSPENKRRYLDTFISGDLEDERACATPAAFPLCNLDRTGAACSTAAESRIQGMPGTTA